jgi:hypothetical protein
VVAVEGSFISFLFCLRPPEVYTNNVWKAKYDLCAFDIRSPRISEYETHERICDQMWLNDQEITMVQIERPNRHVYIKFRDNGRMQDVLH